MNFGVILAGGVGSRMHNDIPKQYVKVEGKPVLVYTMERFQKCARIDSIVIVADEAWREDIWRWIGKYGIEKFLCFADPGTTRQDSVFSGLKACMPYSEDENDKVVIHEAARALASDKLIREIVDGLDGYDACIPVLPVNDSMIFSRTGDTIDDLLDRTKLFCGQAPESFLLHPYCELNAGLPAWERASIRADHELCYRAGWRVKCIPGEENNFKLTTPGDFDRMSSLLRAKKA